MGVRCKPILCQHNRRPSKTVRFNDVGPALEILAVDVQDHIGTRSNQVFVASLKRGSTEVRRCEVALLQHRPHRAVKHEDSLCEQFPQDLAGFIQPTHRLKGSSPFSVLL